MTFCIGICVTEGIVALSDTRIVRGAQTSTKSKLSTLSTGGRAALVMTSGLRSIRDKTVIRLQDRLDANPVQRMHRLASAYGDELRSVQAEDGESLVNSGLAFNSHAIIGGQLAEDRRPSLIHVYPQGNWVEATADEPYFVIGRSYYGKPILDRLLSRDSPLAQALSLAYLAFDATRTSAADVDFPIDAAVLEANGTEFAMQRFTGSDLAATHDTWNERLTEALDALPTSWANNLLAETTGNETREATATSTSTSTGSPDHGHN